MKQTSKQPAKTRNRRTEKNTNVSRKKKEIIYSRIIVATGPNLNIEVELCTTLVVEWKHTDRPTKKCELHCTFAG